MPRPRNPIPTYRLHKSSGQAVVTVNVGDKRRDILLGKYDTPESKTEYQRVLTDLSAGRLFSGAPADLTINELLVKFIAWATDYYHNPNGAHTSELGDIAHAVRPLRELFGHTPAREFGPLAFKRVREEMIAKQWGRTTVNQQAQRVKRVIRWAVENELVPADRWEALRAVKGLAAGRTSAPEPEPVQPVDDATVAATLPHLSGRGRKEPLPSAHMGNGSSKGSSRAILPRTCSARGGRWRNTKRSAPRTARRPATPRI